MSEEKFTCTYCGMELPSADTFHDLQSCAEYMTARIAQLEAERDGWKQDAERFIQLANFNNKKASEYIELHEQLVAKYGGENE